MLARLTTLFVATVLALVPLAAHPQQPQYVWKTGTVNGGTNPANSSMYELQKQLAERTKGRVKLDVYIANQIAKGEGAHLEGVQLGSIDIAATGSAPIGGSFEPLYQALDTPFFWTSREQVWAVMDGPIGQELLKKMEAKGLKGICFGGGWGFRNMMSNKRAIFAPDDMKGQTIRVQESPTYIALMKALGANPVPMPYVEMYLAMKQGTVDGMELPSFSMTADKFEEVTKFYSLTRHSYSPIAYFMNLKKFQALPADIQTAATDAIKATCLAHRKFEVDKEKLDLDVMKKAGVQVNEVKDPKAFQALMKPVYTSVQEKVGKEFFDRLSTAAAQAAK